MNRLKIAYFVGLGGPHPAHSSFIKALREVGDADVVRTANSPTEIVHGFVRFFTNRAPRYELLICDGFGPLILAWLAKKTMVARKLIFITTSIAFLYHARVFRHIMKDIDGVIATSTLMSSVLRKLFCYEGPITLCYPVADISDFLKIKPSLSARRICFVGKLTWLKGVDLLPEIVKEIRKEMKDVEIYVIGSGELMDKIDKVDGLRVFGYVPHDERLLLLSKCSIYIHPARFEAFGVSVIEAMAAGLIPVVTVMTGARDFVKKVNPKLVVPLNPKVIAERIIEILTLNPNELCELSSRARKEALKWTEERAKKHFIQCIKSIISGDRLAFTRAP
ncbi:MAG: glycosyltransferase family 4 protein [Desulfurococcaceae archaeon]